MKNGLFISIVVCISLFISSCKKDTSVPTEPNPLPDAKDSAFVLSEMFYSDVYNAGNNNFKYEFVYDTLARVQIVNVMSGNNGSYATDEIYTYYYNGTDSLPFKKTGKDLTITNSFIESFFYYYDGQQRLIKDSANYEFETEVNNYTYSSSKIISAGYTVDPAFPADIYYFNDTAFLSSANEVSVVDFLQGSDYYAWKYVYDAHPNPLNVLNIRFAYKPFPVNDFLLEEFTTMKNNVISIDDNNPPNYNVLMQTWTYDTNGYPVSVNVVHSGGSVDDTKVLFQYTKVPKVK